MTDGEFKQQEVQRQVDLAVKFTEISGKLTSIDSKVESIINDMKSKHEDLSDKFDKVEVAVFEPEKGLYARLHIVEAWKTNANRMLWVLVTLTLTGAVSFIFDHLK